MEPEPELPVSEPSPEPEPELPVLEPQPEPEPEPEPTVPFNFEVVDHIDPFDADDLAKLAEGYQEIFFQSFVIPYSDTEYQYTEFALEPMSDSLLGEDPLLIEQYPELDMTEGTYFETDLEFGSEPTFEYAETGDYLGESEARIIWTLSIEGFKDETRPDLVVDMEGNVYAGEFEAYWRDAHDVDIEDPEWSETSYSANPEGIENLYASHPEIFGFMEPEPELPVSEPELENDPTILVHAKLAIVRTLDAISSTSDQSVLLGEVLEMGDSEFLEVSFMVSNHMDMRDHLMVSGTLDPITSQFRASLSGLELSGTVYFQAYALNDAGSNFGSVKRVDLPRNIEEPKKDFSELGPDWFGEFFTMSNSDWIYHGRLQWLYAQPDAEDGLWLWMPGQGWLWTQEGVWPFLYKHDTGDWLYLLTTGGGAPFFFDYGSNAYFPAVLEE